MIVSTLIAVTVAAAEPPAAPKPAAVPAAEKKMACCEKMKNGEGCDCCKGMKAKTVAPADGEHGHDH